MDTISFDGLSYLNQKEHKIDPLKKTKNNKIRKSILTLSQLLAEVVYAPEF